MDNVLCGRVSIVFAHPEVLVSSKKCREMLLSDVYQKKRSLCGGRRSPLHRGLVNALSNFLVT